MHLPTLLLPLLPLLTTAFVIPPSLPDGLYLAPINGTGPLERIDLDALGAPSPATRQRRTAVVDRRQAKVQYEIGRTGRTLGNHDDYNACTQSWRVYWDTNGNVVPAHKMLFCTRGDVVLAACNYRSTDFISRHKNPTLVDYFNGVADRQWGSWTTGWVHFLYYDYSFIDFTFWRDTRGTQICGNL